jgi:adenylylsulfate kinase-like enzyme
MEICRREETFLRVLTQTLRAYDKQSRSRVHLLKPKFIITFFSEQTEPSACALSMDLPRKVLIQMSGAPGSGKSTVANLLAQLINAVVIDHDLIRSFFLDNDIFFEQSAKLSYRFQWILAEDVVKRERNVIIDSTCNYKEMLDQGIALARQHGFSYRYVECRVYRAARPKAAQ